MAIFKDIGRKRTIIIMVKRLKVILRANWSQQITEPSDASL